MTRYAFLLATDKYRHFSPTEFCHCDATLLGQTLFGACDYAEQDVVVDLLGPQQQTSPAQIIERLRELVGRTKDGDTILFFYAGHGTAVGGEPYLVLPQTDPTDWGTTALPLRSISEVLRLSQRICVRLFDACQSGGDVRAPLDPSGFARAVARSSEEGWFTFAACGENEFSYPDPNRQQGVFTARLCDAITESAAGENILPERIKIAVCEKVEDWCRAEGKRQTPQFNSAISGNISFATRKAQEAQAVPPPAVDLGTSLDGRLVQLRAAVQHGRVGGVDHRAALKADVEHLRRAVETAVATINVCGANLEPVAVQRADDFPQPYVDRVVRSLLGLGVKSLHEAKEEREVVEQPRPLIAAMFYAEPKPKVHKTYSVSGEDWPASVVYLSAKSSDGLLPSGMLFFYLIPFHVVSGLLVGYGVTGPSTDPNGESPPLDILSMDRYFKPGADNASVMQASVAATTIAFNERFAKATAQRLSYLEEELARVK